MDETSGPIRAVVFDMFGTVVDWRTGVALGVTDLLTDHLPGQDPFEFADLWRAEYQPAMEAVRSGARPFVRLDVLHRENLEKVLERLGADPSAIDPVTLAEATLAWHRLDPWPDVVAGLTRLRRTWIIAPLSNANLRLALDVAKRAGLPWDAILGAEVAGAYKPTPEAYLRTAEILELAPEQMMLVAAHNSDLAAASAVGFRTGFVARPTEHGPNQTIDRAPTGDWDVVADDFLDLADRLGPLT